MTTTKLLTGLLIAAVFSASAHAANSTLEVTVVNGKQQANFSLGDSKCNLVGDVIQCTPVLVTSN